jgi:hypothetical protein
LHERLSRSIRFWTLLARREGRFLPEFGSFARGDVIVKTSELRRKGVPRSDLKILRQILIWLRSQRTLKR